MRWDKFIQSMYNTILIDNLHFKEKLHSPYCSIYVLAISSLLYNYFSDANFVPFIYIYSGLPASAVFGCHRTHILYLSVPCNCFSIISSSLVRYDIVSNIDLYGRSYIYTDVSMLFLEYHPGHCFSV